MFAAPSVDAEIKLVTLVARTLGGARACEVNRSRDNHGTASTREAPSGLDATASPPRAYRCPTKTARDVRARV
jgi:hypothetical protein